VRYASSTSQSRKATSAGLDSEAIGEAFAAIAAEFQITTVQIPFDEAQEIVTCLYRLGCDYAVSQVPRDKQNKFDPNLLSFLEPLRDLSAGQLLRLLHRRGGDCRSGGGVVGQRGGYPANPDYAVSSAARRCGIVGVGQ